MKRFILLFCSLFALNVLTFGQELLQPQRLVTRATLYGVGYTNLYDTYLSPVEYSGSEVRVMHERVRPLLWGGGSISSQSVIQCHVAYAQNDEGNGSELSMLLNWHYGAHYHFDASPHWQFAVGGLGELNVGGIYNSRNSNNPAQAKAYGNLTASGMVRYFFRLWNQPFTLRYQLNIPLVGLMFSPQYQQSYYEIFTLGNSNGTVCFTSVHNQPSLRQWLTLDIPLRNTTLRVGYVGDVQQADVNGIRSHSYSHTAMVGLVKQFYLVKPKDHKRL